MHAALQGSAQWPWCAYRRGLLQLCPLVGHLDRREFFGGGSTVGAWGGSEEYVRARSHEIWGHRTHPPSFGWEGVSECKESAGRTHAHNARSELPASATWAPGSRRGSEAGAAGQRAGRRTRGCEGQGPGEASLCSRTAKSILACNDRSNSHEGILQKVGRGKYANDQIYHKLQCRFYAARRKSPPILRRRRADARNITGRSADFTLQANSESMGT